MRPPLALRRAAFVLASCLLYACGGGGTRGPAPLAAPRATASPVAAPAATAGPVVPVSIVIGPRAVTTGRRGPRYIPLATQSVTLSATGAANQTLACPSICTVTIGVPTGSETIVAQLYDGPGGTGHILGAGRATATIAIDQNNVVPIFASRVLDTIATAVAPASLPAGASGSAAVTVTAYDPAGNAIAGGRMVDANGNPLTITLAAAPSAPAVRSGYSAGSVALAATSFTDAAGLANVAATYDGKALFSAAITATVGGGTVTTGTATASLALNPTIYEYVGVARVRDARSGPDGNLWLAQYDATPPTFSKVVPPGPGATSVTQTSYTIAGFGPFGVGFSPDRQIWMTNWSSQIARCPIDSLTAGAVDALCTLATTPDTDHSAGVDDGGDGNMYFTDSYRDVYYGPYSGASLTNIGGTGGGERMNRGPDGRLWFAGGQTSCNPCGDPYVTAVSVGTGIATYPPPGTYVTNVAPGLDGNMWFVQKANNTVSRFAPSASTGAPGYVTLALPTAGAAPAFLGSGGDAMYVGETGVAQVARVPFSATQSTDIHEYPVSATVNFVFTGPDGNVYASLSNDKLAKIAL